MEKNRMKKGIFLSSVLATVVAGVMMMNGCGSNSSSVSKAQKFANPAYGGQYKGELTLGSEDKFELSLKNGRVTNGSISVNGITAAAGKDACSAEKPCTVKATRDCYKNKSGVSEVSGYNNSEVRESAFDILSQYSGTLPSGAVARFSGALDLFEVGGRIDTLGTMHVEFKAPPCATDKYGNIWYVNNDGITEGVLDTDRFLIAITPLDANGNPTTPVWVESGVLNPFDPDLREVKFEAKDVDMSHGVRFNFFAVQKNADAVDGKQGATGASTGSTGGTSNP